MLAVLGLASVATRMNAQSNNFPISLKPYTIKTTKNGKKIRVYK